MSHLLPISSFGFFFTFMNDLKLVWSFVIKHTVWSLSVVEFNVGINTFYKLLLRIDVFPLHEREKGLHNNIVKRLSRFRKRLNNLVCPKQLANHFWIILRPLGTVEYQELRGVSVLERLSECCGDRIRTCLMVIKLPVNSQNKGRTLRKMWR